ncbi:MAG: restriction endonuclease subunit S [Verrucomicrobiota bacterium]
MSAWTEKSLDELGFVGRGKSKHRPRDAQHLYGGPYPFIQTGDVKHAELYVSTYSQTYSEAGLAQSKLWPVGTVCITIAANIAETAILGIEACFPDSVIGFVADESKSDARFIKYMMDTIKRHYQQVAQGAAQDNLSLEKLLSFKLRIPNAEEQRSIASLLSAYDDLIDNNRRRMVLLEESARLLYREWFVRLRFPGHESTRIVNGVPEGWEWVELGSVCREGDGIQTGPFGSQLHQSDYTDEGVPVVMPKNMIGFRISVEDIARIPEELAAKLGRHRMIPGDTVYGRRGDIGRRAFISKKQAGWFCGTGSLRIRPEAKRINPRYLFDTLGSPETSGTIANRAKGSTMLNLSAGSLKTVPILAPSRHLQDLYQDDVEPTADMIETLTFQNQKLRAARDLLLPKLMSGEIEV